MIDTKIRGNLTEIEVLKAFMQLGYQVSIPFGEDCRYDLIADINGKLLRIQCKSCTAHFTDDGELDYLEFRTVRQSKHASSGWERTKYTAKEIDFFATSLYNECYLVPQNECSQQKVLRFNPPKNNQKIGVNFAKDYTIEEVLKRL